MSSGDSGLDRESEIPFSRNYSPGDRIAGKYRLESVLGEGGMGMVWLAVNEALEARVALKLIRAELHTQDAADRLLKEARAAAKLEHRGIVRVFDYGQTEFADPFIVMELLDGRSFGEVLDKHSRISAIRSVQTMLPVVDALAFAHRHGIVHRDLKPDNIFLARQTKRTQPKVVDFGIAKFDIEGARGLTQHGVVVGSPGYMAPEQARGLMNVDHRADIWAVCVVLYEAVTGRGAFEGDNYNAMMRSIIEDDVVPITELAAGDHQLWEILARGLQKDREARWSNMRDLGRALAEWLLERGVDRDVTGESLEQAWLTDNEEAGRDVFSAPPPASEAAVELSRMSYPGVPGSMRTPESGALRPPAVPRETISSSGPPPTGAVISVRAALEPREARRSWIPWALGSVAAGVIAFFVMRPSGAPSDLPMEPASSGASAPSALSVPEPAEAKPTAPVAHEPAHSPSEVPTEIDEDDAPKAAEAPTKGSTAEGDRAESTSEGPATGLSDKVVQVAPVPAPAPRAKPRNTSTWKPKPAKKKEPEKASAPALKDPYQ